MFVFNLLFRKINMPSPTSKISLSVIQGSKIDLSQQIYDILIQELPAAQTMALVKPLLLQKRLAANSPLTLIGAESSNLHDDNVVG